MGASRLRVLVVEEDRDSRALFGQVFGEAGIDAMCVDSDALPAPDAFRLVVADLPGRESYSTARAREWVALLGGRYRAPIIVVTGRHEAMVDEPLLGAAFVLQKPFDIDVLVATVRAIASNSTLTTSFAAPPTDIRPAR